MTPRRDDPEHDAWLREALRHAPDADIAAPPAVSDSILRQARAATVARVAPVAPQRPAPPTVGLLEGVAAFWTWLARPSVATGFASVMVATVVGMLWWGRPMDEAAMPPPVPAAADRMPQAPAPAPAPAPAVAPVDARSPAPVQEDEEQSMEARDSSPVHDGAAKVAAPLRSQPRARVTASASPADTMRDADRDLKPKRSAVELGADAFAKREAARATAAAGVSPTEPMKGATPSVPQRPAAPTTAAQDDATSPRGTAPVAAASPAAITAAAAPERNDAAEARAMARDGRTAPSPAPRTAPAAAPGLAADASAEPQAAARAEVRSARDAQVRAKAAAVAGAGAADPLAAPGMPNAADATMPAATALSDLRQAIATEPERWSWQRGDGAAHAMTSALQAWLARLGHGGTSEAPRSADTTAPRLRLLRDGRLHSSLVLGGDHLQLLPADTARPALQWSLAPAAAATLRDALDAATR